MSESFNPGDVTQYCASGPGHDATKCGGSIIILILVVLMGLGMLWLLFQCCCCCSILSCAGCCGLAQYRKTRQENMKAVGVSEGFMV